MIGTPTLEDLSIFEMKLDAHTQRTWDPKWSKKIHDNFDEEQLGVFRISRREDGGLYVLDGQHRLHACRDLGWAEDESFVQCLVYEGLTPGEEAELYLAFNVRTRKANTVDTFRLEVVAEEPVAVAIQEVLDKHGLNVSYGGGGNQISAVGALREVYKLGGVELIDQVITIVESAWGTNVRDARDGSILRGLALVLAAAGAAIDLRSLADKLGKSGKPGQLIGEARTYKAATRRPLHTEVAHAIVSIYNVGRRGRRIAI